MKKWFILFLTVCATWQLWAAEATTIRISTDKTDLLFKTSPDKRLYQVYLGDKLLHAADIQKMQLNTRAGYNYFNSRGWEAYSSFGSDERNEPALAITHADGKMLTYLYYKGSEQKVVPGGTETIIHLQDDQYPVDVNLHYVAYAKENVIKTWSEIVHKEKKPINLWRYASAILYFYAPEYYLTAYHGEWAREGQPSNQKLEYGKKVIDAQNGTQTAQFSNPFFELGIGNLVKENEGKVMLGTIGWTGNFSFTFQVDNAGNLSVIPAINSFASYYSLKAGNVFTTPEFIFTLSDKGAGQATRNLHDWARNYSVKDGTKDRMTILNNWENTYFNFNQDKIVSLIKEAKDLGVDLFLLDDGWFGNKYPRQNDTQGLGDWEETRTKLPGGIPALTKAAKETGVKFGIWIEPEMVNPKSELFEIHPDWVIRVPNRKTYYARHQLVLDLSNPAVQEHVYNVIDRIMKEGHGVAYFKWDCNSPFTNIYSPYNKENQNQLFIDYVRGLYKVLQRVKKNYPDLPMMLCSSGGARCDYEALKYFTEFWVSDDTDPYERLYIQWSMSKFFPTKTLAAHVTDWNRQSSIKFRTDVASMCKLGFDINLDNMPKDNLDFCKQTVKNYNRMKPVILEGDMFHLVSPYETQNMAVNYVSKDKSKAIIFGYNLRPRYGTAVPVVYPQGLDPNKQYTITETNLMPGKKSAFNFNGQTFSGDFLMKNGLNILGSGQGESHVFELNAQ